MWFFYLWLIILTIVVIAVVIVLVVLNNSKSGKKEFAELKIALLEGVRDGKLTTDEKARISKEFADIPWAKAFREAFDKLLSKTK